VTGATSGIGLEIARGLAGLGARVIMVGRDPGKAARAAEQVGGSVEVALADLSSLDAVRALGAELLERCPRIDVLMSNAGVYRMRRRLTVDGFEETFAVNHLASFLLTHLLLDRLKASAPARIVMVASGAHHGAVLDLDDLQLSRAYGHWKAYSRSKLANVMFTYALARRLDGTGVTANSLHPGFVATHLGSGNHIPVRPFYWVIRPFVRSPRAGARTAVYLASSPECEGENGGYWFDERRVSSSPFSLDEELQERLWAESEALVGLP